MDIRRKVTGADLLAAREELDITYIGDAERNAHAVREIAERIAGDREIEEAKVLVMVASIEDADLAYGKGTDMARKAAYRLGLRDMFASRKTLAAYLVDQGLSWYEVAKMNS